MKKIVIFASGGGSNAQAIIDYFEYSTTISIVQILTNNSHAGVLDRAKKAGIGALSFNKSAFAKANSIHQLLKSIDPDLIVLAGFLWKFPDFLVADFPDKIINIHPALLPNYGGKGMYGMNVHRAVVENQEKESGITIHYVNDNYDEGAIIRQEKCEIDHGDQPDDVAGKVLALEHEYFAITIERLLK